MKIMKLAPLVLTLMMGASGCDEDNGSGDDEVANDGIALDDLHRRVELRDVPGRWAAAWDAMFASDIEAANVELETLITADATITFLFPDGAFETPPGAEGWIAAVTGAAAAGQWVPAGPGLQFSVHNAGSVNVLEETSTTARLRQYVRASHYSEDTTVDISEGIFEFDLVYDEEAQIWKVAHLDLTPMSLRDEGGEVLPPVSSDGE